MRESKSSNRKMSVLELLLNIFINHFFVLLNKMLSWWKLVRLHIQTMMVVLDVRIMFLQIVLALLDNRVFSSASFRQWVYTKRDYIGRCKKGEWKWGTAKRLLLAACPLQSTCGDFQFKNKAVFYDCGVGMLSLQNNSSVHLQIPILTFCSLPCLLLHVPLIVDGD